MLKKFAGLSINHSMPKARSFTAIEPPKHILPTCIRAAPQFVMVAILPRYLTSLFNNKFSAIHFPESSLEMV